MRRSPLAALYDPRPARRRPHPLLPTLLLPPIFNGGRSIHHDGPLSRPPCAQSPLRAWRDFHGILWGVEQRTQEVAPRVLTLCVDPYALGLEAELTTLFLERADSL